MSVVEDYQWVKLEESIAKVDSPRHHLPWPPAKRCDEKA